MRYPVETPVRVACDAASRTFRQAHELRRDDALLARLLPRHRRWPLLLCFVLVIHF
jgi:hypothetical protein